MKSSTLDYFEELKNDNETFLVDFWAPWCAPCKVLTPLLEKIQADYPQIQFIKIDITSIVNQVAEMGITSVPTVMIFKNGILDSKSVGVQSELNYRNRLDSVL